MTMRRWLIVIAAVALDLAVLLHGPSPLALFGLILTVLTVVFGGLYVLIRWGNSGPGKTLY